MESLLRVWQSVLDEVRDGLRLMPAPDDAMRSLFRRNDLIVIDARDVTATEGVYLIDCAGSLIVRRIREAAPSKVILTADDPAIRPVCLWSTQLAGAVLGRVVAAFVRVPFGA